MSGPTERVDGHLAGVERQPPSERTIRRVMASGAAGLFMETYDFGIYGLVAAYLTVEFFTAADPTTSLLITWAVFAIPFLIRPLGGLVLGAVGDRLGRKKVMLFSIVAIAAATALIGAVPSAATIGIAAPLAVLFCRLLQGFVYGGETANAITFVGEWTPRRTRASRLAWVQAGGTGGNLFGSILAFLLSFSLGPVLMQAWGWRVLFLFALPLAGLGFYVRMKIDETPAFRNLQASGDLARTPIRDTVRDRATRLAIVKCILLGALQAAGYYVIYIQLPAYLVREVGFSGSDGLLVTLIGLGAMLVLTPIWGRVADHTGRRRLGIASAVVLAVVLVPCFTLMSNGLGAAVVGILVLTVVYSVHNALTLGAIFEVLTTRTRSTAFSIAWGVCVAVFGGAAPFICTGLIALTGYAQRPALFVALACVLSGVGYAWYRDPSDVETGPAVEVTGR